MKTVHLLLIAILVVATITSGCTSAGYKNTCACTVTDRSSSTVYKVAVSPGNGIVDAKIDYSIRFTATAYDVNGNLLSVPITGWAVYRVTGSATIDQQGVLTPIAAGEVVVIANIDGKIGLSVVKIEKPPVIRRTNLEKCYDSGYCEPYYN